MNVHTPSLGVLLLFRDRQRAEESLKAALVKRLGLTQEAGGEDERCYRGPLEEALACQVRARMVHDTFVVRCDLTLEGEGPIPAAWQRLTHQGEALLDLLSQHGAAPPWAITWFYHAVLPAGAPATTLSEVWGGWPLPLASTPVLEPTPYGWLGMLGESERMFAPQSACRERRLVLLVPQERRPRVERYFLQPLLQGWARIERHLHKALHHARLQKEVSQVLGQATLDLRAQMAAAVSTMDFAHIYRESRELEQVSISLMAFLHQKAHAEMVLQSLRVNLHDFTLALEEVKLTTPLYEKEKLLLKQCIDQLESDLEYARVITESTYAFQEMQRGIENNRLQRAGVMLSTAAALLAGITIFNSFLDIWALILDGSGWVLPPMWARMTIGLLAGVSLPLAAYWAIERRRRMMLLWSVLGGLSFVLAVLSTLWVNRS